MKPATKLHKKQTLLAKRRMRIRKLVIGTAERPRLSVKFTNLHIYAQAIDDAAGKTLAAAATTQKEVREKGVRPNVAGATVLGKLFAERAKAAGISAVVFDRGGRRFHGTVKAFAEAARQSGLSF